MGEDCAKIFILMHKKIKKLSLEIYNKFTLDEICLDKIEEPYKEAQPIFTARAKLLIYVNPLCNGRGSLIIKSEDLTRYKPQVLKNKINWNDRHTQHAYIFSLISSLLGISLFISLFYLAIKLTCLAIVLPTV
ncbi:MAG: hypothetical protein PV340_00100 [Wolbachia sp.]|nr:hypothetical protein [Wolbachia sp.]MDD9336554.1 hypothetical protein [Wolbachia sp.]